MAINYGKGKNTSNYNLLSDSDITLRPSSYKVGVDKFKCIDAVDSLCLPLNVKMSKLVNF